MSGFSAAWLALRAPFDAAARDSDLARRFLGATAEADLIVDLGAGTGSNVDFLRALAPRRRWRLAESDPALLRVAGDRFAADPLVGVMAADLARALPAALDAADAVTCSALLDLTSARWIDSLVEALVPRRLPALFALSYDGRMRWDPPDRDDARVADAFHRDMTRDKGFGPSLGPDAVSYARRVFARAGARVEQAVSDWVIPRRARPMLGEMIDGAASAAADDALLRAEHVAGWRTRRLEQLERGALSLRVGHQDLLIRWA